jgi:hypothetical protein
LFWDHCFTMVERTIADPEVAEVAEVADPEVAEFRI